MIFYFCFNFCLLITYYFAKLLSLCSYNFRKNYHNEDDGLTTEIFFSLTLKITERAKVSKNNWRHLIPTQTSPDIDFFDSDPLINNVQLWSKQIRLRVNQFTLLHHYRWFSQLRHPRERHKNWRLHRPIAAPIPRRQ